jgi:tight adherence protein C
MILLYLGAIVAAMLAAGIGVYSLMPSPSQMYELRTRTAGRAEAATIQSPLLKLLWPLLAAIAPYTRGLASEEKRQAKARELPLAGLPPVITVDHFLAMKVVMAIRVPLCLAFPMTIFRNPVLFLTIGWVGYLLPDRMITEQRRAREQLIVRRLPPAVDMLTLAVEAGQDFLGGLQRVIDKGSEGPLRQEITTIINDIRLGSTRASALRAFAARIDVPEIVAFVAILVQAERLGASIGSVLRAQADRMRSERFMKAEREGAKASQKLLIPLAAFIFPAVMLVLIAPAVLGYIYGPALP